MVCRTFSSMRITTAPPRWTMPRIGGFSLPSVPRPRAPAPLSGTGAGLSAPYFHRCRMPLVTGHDVHFITFHFSRQDRFRLAADDPAPELFGHPLDVIWVHAQLLGDLRVGQVQSHEIQTQNPNPQRLMMPRQHCARQIVKIAMTPCTSLFLSRRLGGVATLFRDIRRDTMRTTDPVGPPQLANGVVALNIVQQILKVDHRQGSSVTAFRNSFSVAPYLRQSARCSTVRNPY